MMNMVNLWLIMLSNFITMISLSIWWKQGILILWIIVSGREGLIFGLSTDIKRREIGYNDIWPIAYRLGVPESLVYEERLRTKAITLAIENHDYECLEELNARVNPAIYNLTIFDNRGEGLEEQRMMSWLKR